MKKLTSRKLWLAVLAALIPVLNEQLGLNLNTTDLAASVGGLLSFIVMEGIKDIITELKKEE